MLQTQMQEAPHSASPFPQPERNPEALPILLVIDDERALNHTLALHFAKEYQVHSAVSGVQGLAAAEQLRPACVLLDMRLPDMSGLEVLQHLQHLSPPPLVIIMTAYSEIRSAVQAIKLGAIDYVSKPFDVNSLRQNLSELLQASGLVASQTSGGCEGFDLGEKRIIGASPQIRAVWALVERFAPTNLSLLLQGETGTGKELFARAIHTLSKRSATPFVPVDCAAVPDSLWESEFFGYEKGAFTGANQAKTGLFMQAHKGTLFLDEVGNLPLSLQAKLLRVLQEREVRPLGAKHPVRTDVRVVAASNANLCQQISEGTFRADLYYRLNQTTLYLPPLRDRQEDIPLVVRHFVELHSQEKGKQVTIAPQAMDLLTQYAWPGNCREVENVVRAALFLADEHLLPHHLPAYLSDTTLEFRPHVRQASAVVSLPPSPSPSSMDIQVSLQVNARNGIDLKQVGASIATQVEGEMVHKILALGLTQAEVAAFFKIDPKTLRAKLRAGQAHASE